MKLAITSQGTDLTSTVDLRFGRAKYLIIFDCETEKYEVHDNDLNLNAVQGAGIQTGQNIAELGVDAVITGNVGPKAFRTLKAANIAIYLSKQQTVNESINDYKNGTLTQAKDANVEGHWL